MKIELVTIADEQYGMMMRVAFSSLQEFGDMPDSVTAAVYDFGLGDGDRDWCKRNNVEVRSLESAPKPILPFNWKASQIHYWLLVCKTWAIGDAADHLDVNDVLVFFDSDMAAVDSCWPEIVDAAESADGWVAVLDPFRLGEMALYANDPQKLGDADFWRRWFGEDHRATPAWNVGLLAARADVARKTYNDWQEMNLRWVNDEGFADAFSFACVEQLTFSILMTRGDGDYGPPQALPDCYNVTRPLWTMRPEIIPLARAIHLTGPIKPWEPGGATHPMTMLWRDVANHLQAKGRLD